MLRNHANSNIGNASGFVNGLVTVAIVALIGASYITALSPIVFV